MSNVYKSCRQKANHSDLHIWTYAGDLKELSKKFKLWRNILKFVFRNYIDGMGSGYWHTGIR